MRTTRNKDLLSYLLAAGLLLATAVPIGAQEAAEQQQDINYSADGGGSIETVDGIRITTLQGNVLITRGGSRISGDRAELEQDPESGEFHQATVSGSPARFRRAGDNGDDPIVGHSDTIRYFTRRQDNGELRTIVEFIGEASFSRGRTSLQCQEIRHVIETGTTDSPGPCSGVVTPEDN